MSRVKIDALKTGNILAEDIRNANGRFLLGKGVIIEPTHLRVLKIWGITSAEIEGGPEDPSVAFPEAIDPALLRAADEYARRSFCLANLDHPCMQEILDICTRRQARKMLLDSSGEGPAYSAEAEILPSFSPGTAPAAPVNRRRLDALLEEDVSLPSLPEIFLEISKVISDPRSSVLHVANVISNDTSLSARLLKIVNSAFYGFPSKIGTTSRAVMIVGSKQLSTLSLGTSVIHIFRDIPAELVDMKSFWKHSIACGIGARMLASFKGACGNQ